jgi:hypothetical protein
MNYKLITRARNSIVEKVHTDEIETKEIAIGMMNEVFDKGNVRLARVETVSGKHVRDRFRNNP